MKGLEPLWRFLAVVLVALAFYGFGQLLSGVDPETLGRAATSLAFIVFGASTGWVIARRKSLARRSIEAYSYLDTEPTRRDGLVQIVGRFIEFGDEGSYLVQILKYLPGAVLGFLTHGFFVDVVQLLSQPAFALIAGGLAGAFVIMPGQIKDGIRMLWAKATAANDVKTETKPTAE